jgi:hypothetical protein
MNKTLNLANFFNFEMLTFFSKYTYNCLFYLLVIILGVFHVNIFFCGFCFLMLHTESQIMFFETARQKLTSLLIYFLFVSHSLG